MNSAEFMDQVRRRQSASFGGLKVVTRDAHVCLSHLRAALKGRLLTWSCAAGIWKVGEELTLEAHDKKKTDPFEIALELRDLLNSWSEHDQTTLVFQDMDHWIEAEPQIRRHLLEAVKLARAKGHLLIFMSRHLQFHSELADEISILKHPLPDRDSSREELSTMMSNHKIDNRNIESALDAVQGLTSSRQADAFSLAIVDALLSEKKEIDVSVLRRYKETEIGKLDYLKVGEPSKSFDDLMGHELLKEWIVNRKLAFHPDAREAGLPVPKGMLMVGPPGTGKSRLVEAVAQDWGVPWLTLDVGSVFSSLLGESEEQLSNALEIAEKMAPCVLLVDEVERAFGGEGKGDRDGGTSGRVIGKFLSWMSNKEEAVFVVFTSNQAKDLPAAMIRKGRLDEIWFLDLPEVPTRKAVFEYYLSKAPHAVSDEDIQACTAATSDWVPAEIEAAVGAGRFTAFADERRKLEGKDILAEIKKTTPVAKSMETQVTAMREWAKQHARATEESNRPWANSANNVRAINVDTVDA